MALEEGSQQLESPVVEGIVEAHSEDGITTTEEEIQGYHIVRAIVGSVVEVKRVIMRDVKSYCGVLLDDTNRKPICRLWFNSPQKYVGLVDEHKQEEKVPIDDIDDLYKYADRLKATVGYYERSPVSVDSASTDAANESEAAWSHEPGPS